MDTSNVISSVFGVALKGGISIATIITLGVALIIWHRTRSTHMLMTRLWVLFNGKKEHKNPVINEFMEAQSALLMFRFTTGLQAKTLDQVKTLLAWIKKNNEDISAVRACGGFFDVELPGLKNEKTFSKTWLLLFLLLFITALGMATTLSTGGIIFDRALLKMNKTGKWLTLNESTAKPLSDQHGFKLSECSSDHAAIAKISGFAQSDVEDICTSFTNSNTADYVKAAVYSQRIVFSVLTAMLLWCFFPMYFLLMQMENARMMFRRITKLEEKSKFNDYETSLSLKE